ncbi:MAG: AAA family ATPase [Dysgonamonadaceae bacterium]|jgi:chromosome partitioning protein|nr:AAA family ATPase [Dysgonamonadaceae bacterium]
MKKVISIINHKGGVGKTTSTANIGAGLCRLGQKVLLIDMDPQANLSINFGIDPQKYQTIYDALSGRCPIPIIPGKKNLPDIVPSTLDLSVAEMELNNEPGRESILKRLLSPVYIEYDYILIDCPPSLGLLTLNALTTSEACIIPVELSNFSLVGMTKLFDVIDKVRNRINPNLDSYAILATRTDKRQAIHRELSIYLREKYGQRMFSTEIRSNVKILESQAQRTDIFSFDERSNAAMDYLNVCRELIQFYSKFYEG